jgi:hypothetical protein
VSERIDSERSTGDGTSREKRHVDGERKTRENGDRSGKRTVLLRRKALSYLTAA